MSAKKVVWSNEGGQVSGDPVITDDRTLDEAKARAASRAQAELAAKVAAGFTYSSVLIAIDPASRGNISGKALQALISMQAGSGITWSSDMAWLPQGDGEPLALPTAQDMITFGDAVATHYTNLVLYEAQLEAQIAALTTNDACDAFDVTQGWPVG